MKESTKLQLVPDKSSCGALKCLLTALSCGAQLEVVAKDNPPAATSSTTAAASNITERPTLIAPAGAISSAYAVCRYIIDIANTANSCTNTSFYPNGILAVRVEEFVDYTIRTAEPGLVGSRQRVSEILTDLNLRASAGTGQSLVQGSPATCFGDIFLLPALLRRKCCISKHGYTHLAAYLTHCLSIAAVKEALRQLPGAEPPPDLPPPDVTAQQTFYLTTAINYTNGPPHIGHAYEAVTSDVICRYHRIFGRKVWFQTGTDEHGQKIAQTAAQKGVLPQSLCDQYAEVFQNLNRQLNVSEDFFVRTTSEQHKRVSQWLWHRVASKGDIYLDNYVGWYNVREETFVTETEAQQNNYKDPATGADYMKMEEPSYFFNMGKYQEVLIRHIQQNERFIMPSSRRNEILSRLREPLAPLSLSRTTFQWGIPVPGASDHVMYVWFDALTNYLSGLNYPDGPLAKAFWPANVHIIGKDIVWFHSVIWPCMLFSADVPLPETIFGHGHVHAADGKKMSKSFGTAINPSEILETYQSDTFRYFLAKEAAYGSDMKYDMDRFIDTHNAELADVLGNLVHRAVGLCAKLSDGVVPNTDIPDCAPPFDYERLAADTEMYYSQYALQDAASAVMNACRDTNKYLTIHAPWSQTTSPQHRLRVVRAIVEATFVLAHFLEPFIPHAAAQIFSALKTAPKKICELSPYFDNLTPGNPVDVSAPILFAKLLPKDQQ